MNEIQLRDYQQECVDIINNTESGSYLVAVATGLGKTVIFSHIARRGRMLILSHREELVWQPKKYFDCSYGVEKADIHSNGEEVVSASVQSLVRRLDSFSPDDFDIIITDEAHHAVAPTYKKSGYGRNGEQGRDNRRLYGKKNSLHSKLHGVYRGNGYAAD